MSANVALSETFDGASATLIPFGDDIGSATSFNIVEHGINYTSAPTFVFPHYAILKTVSGAITADETFTTDISGATGTVIDYTAPLLKYTATKNFHNFYVYDRLFLPPCIDNICDKVISTYIIW